ncbi:MAG TPA: ABC transporter ATP-binding protein, partial [Opitutaceae bacterium]|nr:ABC transporter ATP-binding protein [Opitutaceae bacterium]
SPATPETGALAAGLAGHGTVTTDAGLHHFRPAPGHRLSEFFALAEARGLPPRLFTHQRPTLEALFLHLTGRTLRE